MRIFITQFSSDVNINEAPRCTMEFIPTDDQELQELYRSFTENKEIRLEIGPKELEVIAKKARIIGK